MIMIIIKLNMGQIPSSTLDDTINSMVIKQDPRIYSNQATIVCTICNENIEIHDLAYRSSCEHKFHNQCYHDNFKKNIYKCRICNKPIGGIPLSALTESELNDVKNAFNESFSKK